MSVTQNEPRLTPNELAELKRLEAEATPEPWDVGYRALSIDCVNTKIGGVSKLFDVRGLGYLTGGGHGALGLPHDQALVIQTANATLVTTLRNHAKSLIAAVEDNITLRARLEKAEGVIEAARRATRHHAPCVEALRDRCVYCRIMPALAAYDAEQK